MDLITALLFERPLYLVPVLLVVQFVLIRQWARFRTNRSRRMMILGFVCIPLLLALQAVVRTDREELVALCRALARNAEEADMDAFGRQIAPQFDTEGIDRDEFLRGVELGLKAVHPENSKLRDFRVTFDGSKRATVLFQASARIYGPFGMGGRKPSRWEIRFQRIGDDWKIIFLSPRQMVGWPFDSLRDLLIMVGGI